MIVQIDLLLIVIDIIFLMTIFLSHQFLIDNIKIYFLIIFLLLFTIHFRILQNDMCHVNN
jgi:predicted neutral ceramidase superfamily lipid hydrolase